MYKNLVRNTIVNSRVFYIKACRYILLNFAISSKERHTQIYMHNWTEII